MEVTAVSLSVYPGIVAARTEPRMAEVDVMAVGSGKADT